VSRLPHDWATRLKFDRLPDLALSLPPDWDALALDGAAVLPPRWRQAVAALPPGWDDALCAAPPGWAAKLHFGRWHVMLDAVPPHWLDIVRGAVAARRQHQQQQLPGRSAGAARDHRMHSSPAEGCEGAQKLRLPSVPYHLASRKGPSLSAVGGVAGSGGFDARPVPREVAARANLLMDGDLRGPAGRSRAWQAVGWW
jgi:hypothetical protein